MFSTINVLNNLDKKNIEFENVGELGVFSFFLGLWNKVGRYNNRITPRITFALNKLHMSKPTFLKYRKKLIADNLIVMHSGGFNRKGHRKPAVISFPDWLVQSDRIVADDNADRNNEKSSSFADINNSSIRAEKTPRKLTAVDLDGYGKDLFAQIGATSATPAQLKRIKTLENNLSNEVIKEVRNYVRDNSKSNPISYYWKILIDLRKQNVTNIHELHNSNSPFRTVNYSYVATVPASKPARATNRKSYNGKKRVEVGTDWNKKIAEQERINQQKEQEYDQIHGAGAWQRKQEQERQEAQAFFKALEAQTKLV